MDITDEVLLLINENKMNTKPWYQSKMIWLAIAQGITGVMAAFFATDPNLAHVGYLAAIKSIFDFALRATSSSVIE